MTLFSILNAYYTFSRKRHYRLFEKPIEAPQSTPSAHRVRVDSSPISASPLRFLTSVLGDSSAESRSHPDPTRDVWELAVWDPLPICLGLFCSFSPVHILVYLMFLPTLASDPRPSVTVFTTLLIEILLTIQLNFIQSSFSQQIKDTAVISKEVMSEYDTKFVNPRLHPTVRDVGTQYVEKKEGTVETYTPTVLLRREFKTHANQNYAKHLDPDYNDRSVRKSSTPTPAYTPAAQVNPFAPKPFNGAVARQHQMRQPQFRPNPSGVMSSGTSTGDGGSLGIYSHPGSPLKKATSMYDMTDNSPRRTPKNSYDMARQEFQDDRQRERNRKSLSPEKRYGEAPRPLLASGRVPFPDVEDDRRTSAPTAFGSRQKPNAYELANGRLPSRF